MALPIVKRFVISFEQNWWLGLLALATSLGISGVVAFMLPKPVPPRPTYTATGALTFDSLTPAFTATGNQLQQQSRVISKETLLSEKVLRGVMAKLKLSVDDVVKIRDQDLTITFPDPKKQAGQPIQLQYTDSQSPTRSLLILETFMKEMIAYSRWLNTAQLRSKIDGLSKRLAQAQKDLTAAEEKFYRYITKQGSDILAIQDGSLFSSISISKQRQRELNLAIEQLDGQINGLEKQLGLNPKQAYTSVALSADPIIEIGRAHV